MVPKWTFSKNIVVRKILNTSSEKHIMIRSQNTIDSQPFFSDIINFRY